MLDDNLSDDEVYELLSNPTRREAIKYFNQAGEVSHSFEDVAGYLHDKTEKTFDAIEKRLHHVDLPKLQNADVLLYDHEEKKITYIGNESLEERVDVVE